MTIQFNTDQKERIKQSLEQLGIKDVKKQTQIIDYIAENRSFEVFGYGSLPDYSHLESGSKELLSDDLATRFPNLDIEAMQNGFRKAPGAYIEGFKADFVCADFTFRGQKGSPSEWGLTAGLLPIENAKTPGAVLNIPIENMDPQEATDFIVYNLTMFQKREFPPGMPIYTMDFLEVELADGTKSQALICLADTESHLYFGNLSIEERAAKIARAIGPDTVIMEGDKGEHFIGPAEAKIIPRGIGQRTDLDYLAQMIANSLQKNLSVDRDLYELYTESVQARADLKPQIREELEYWDAIDHNALMMELNARLERYNFSSMPKSNGSLTGGFAIVAPAGNDNSSINLSTPAIVRTLSANVTDPDGHILTAA